MFLKIKSDLGKKKNYFKRRSFAAGLSWLKNISSTNLIDSIFIIYYYFFSPSNSALFDFYQFIVMPFYYWTFSLYFYFVDIKKRNNTLK